MNDVIRSLELPVIEALGWALLHFVWQGAVIAAVLAVMLLAMRRVSARVRYLVLCGILGVMVACPVATWWWIASTLKPVVREVASVVDVVPQAESLVDVSPVLGPMVTSGTNLDGADAGAMLVEPAPLERQPQKRGDGQAGSLPHVAAPSRAEAVRRAIEPALPWLVSVWLIGVVVLSLRLLVGWRIVQRMKRLSHTPAADVWQERLKDLAARLRVTRPIRLVESALVEVPTVIGWLRPMILLPASILIGLTPQQLEAILAHELAHVRRHDYLVNLIQTAVETLLFYHPAIWWLSRRIRDEREHCCDDLAVEVCGNTLTYAQALTTMEELRSRDEARPATALTLAADGGSLLARIRRLALGPNADNRRSTWWGASLTTLTTVVALGVAAYTASHVNNHANADLPPTLTIVTQSSPAPEGVTSAENAAESNSDQAMPLVEQSKTTVVGTVVSPDGKPVAGIEVLAFKGGEQLKSRFTTDERGGFRVPKEWREAETWLTVVARDGRERLGWFDFMVHGHADIGQKSEDGSFRIVLLPMSRTVRGRVLDDEGKPLTKVSVRINQLNHDVNLNAVHWRYQKLDNEALVLGAITDEEGRYEIKLPADTFAWLGASHPDRVEQNIRVPKDHDELVDTKLVRAAKVAGRVTDSRTEMPLAGVTIAAHAHKTELFESGGDEAKTDADGNYVIRGLRSGEYTIQLEGGAAKTLTAPAFAKAELKPGETFAADFSLSVGRRLIGRVLDMDTGKPIPDCTVTNSGPARPLSEQTTTNEKGAFEFFVPPGKSRLDSTLGRRFGSDSTREVDVPADGELEPIVLKVGEKTESVPGSIKIFLGLPLDRMVRLNFKATPLAEALDQICNDAGMKLELDEAALTNAGFTKHMAVTLTEEKPVTFKDALTRVLKPFEKLSFTVDQNRIVVSTREVIQKSERPKRGEKLDPDSEAKLKWGEAVNGLRGAIAIRHSTDKPQAGDKPDIYLALQNVSQAPIRLTDMDVPKDVNLRVLYPRKEGRIMAGLGTREPALGDVTLQPHEVTFLPFFDPDTKVTVPEDPTLDGRTLGASFAEDVLNDARQSLTAKLQIDQAPAGSWTGQITTGEMTGADTVSLRQPKGKEALSLFKKWQSGARANGNIPGGALEPLARVMARFIKNNPTHEGAPKFTELLKRIDTSRDWSRDWSRDEAVMLLDEVTAIYPSLPEWVEGEKRFTLGGDVETGKPLPDELKDAPWGEAQPNGLRVAWLLEPRAKEHRLNTPLKSRLLFHNSGKNAVVFRALTWNQSGNHKARDEKGDEINISSVEWTTIPRVFVCRLAPGDFMEVVGAGIGVGANKDQEDWRETRVGSWIDAKAGDDVTFLPAPVYSHGRGTDEPIAVDAQPAPSQWWLRFIKDRLNLDSPLPADVAERGRLLDRAMHDLFGNVPSDEELTAFKNDATSDALDALAKRLAQRLGFEPFSGLLTSGPTKFKVLPVDPDAAKKPRTAKNPGQYKLGGNATFVVTRRGIGERTVNEARLTFSSTDATKPAPREPHEIKLPDGYDTWAAAWMRGGTVLWVQQKGTVNSYDISNPAQVKETTLEEPAQLDNIPKPIRETLRSALDVPDAPRPPQVSATSNVGATAKPAAGVDGIPSKKEAKQQIAELDQKVTELRAEIAEQSKTLGQKHPAILALERQIDEAWSAKVTLAPIAGPQLAKLPDEAYTKCGIHCQLLNSEDQLRPRETPMGPMSWLSREEGLLVLGMRVAKDARWRIGGSVKVELWVRNRSNADVKFSQCSRTDNGLNVVAIDKDGKEHSGNIAQFDSLLVFNHLLLLADGHAVMVKELSVRFDEVKSGISEPSVAAFHLAPGKYSLRCKWSDTHTMEAHEGEWTGELTSGDRDFMLAAPDGAIAQPVPSNAPDENAGERSRLPIKGLDFLKPYPKLHGLSLDMTEKQFLEIAKQQDLKPQRTPYAKNPRYEIGTGDGHTVIVMFGNNGEKCSGIQRIRGDVDTADLPSAPAAPTASSWASFRHDLAQTGIAVSPLPEKLVPLWETTLGGPVRGTAAIVGGHVYVPCLSGELVCFEKRTGRRLWVYQSERDANPLTYSPGFKAAPTVTADAIYLGDDEGTLHAIDRATGARRWIVETEGDINGSAVVVSGKVLVGARDIHCFNEKDGAFVWKVATNCYVQSTPTVVGGDVLIPACNGHFRVIDIATGTQKSDFELGNYFVTSPAVIGDIAYVGASSSSHPLLAVNWKTGNINWRYSSEQGDLPFVSSPAVTDKLVVIGCQDKHVHAIDRATGKLVWKFATSAKVDSSPVILGQRVFVGSDDGHLYELDLATGTERAKFPLGKRISASPAIGEGVLVIGSESNDGKVVCFGGAATAPQSNQAAGSGDPRRAQEVEANKVEPDEAFDAKQFRLVLTYHGESDKPFYNLILSVSLLGAQQNLPTSLVQQISEEQATKIVKYLKTSEFFRHAQITDHQNDPESGPQYLLRVRHGNKHYQETLGWDVGMLIRVDGIRRVLDGDAAKSMDQLLARLNGQRKVWESGEVVKDLKTTLSAEEKTFAAGKPIPIKLEVANVGNEDRQFGHHHLILSGSEIIVTDEHGRRVPYLAGGAGLQQSQITIKLAETKVIESCDLSPYYYLRRPGRYIVAFRAAGLPPSNALHFEVSRDAAATADGDPVGRLLPLVKERWRLGASASQIKAQPGRNWSEITGRGLTFIYNPPSTNKDAGHVWLWLSEMPATELPPDINSSKPAFEYLGKISRWHVYFLASEIAQKAWPTAKDDITRALAAAPTLSFKIDLDRAVIASGENVNLTITMSNLDTADIPLPPIYGATRIILDGKDKGLLGFNIDRGPSVISPNESFRTRQTLSLGKMALGVGDHTLALKFGDIVSNELTLTVEGLPNSDNGQSKSDTTNGDRRSNQAAGSGDPSRAQSPPTPASPAAKTDNSPWGQELNGLQTRVTLQTEKPAVGQPLKVKIELQNVGKIERAYSSQRANPDYLLDVVGPDGKPAEFINGGAGIPVQTLKIKPGETVVLWDEVDVASMFLLSKLGQYEIKLRGTDKFVIDEKKPEQTHPYPMSNTLAVTLADGTLNDIQATFVRIRNVAPKDWGISTRGNSISNIQKRITRRGEFHLFFSKELKADEIKLGETTYQHLGQTRLGHAYLAATPDAITEWPDCVEKIREQLPPPEKKTGATSPPDGLEFIQPYPKLHGLSFDMTEPQFLEIAKQQGLKPRRSPEAKDPHYWIGTGDGHIVIVMFGNKGDKCSGIQRIRGELPSPAGEKAAKPVDPMRVRAQGDWSEEFLALCKTVAGSRGLKEWKAEDFIAWGQEVDGLRAGLVMESRVKLGGQLPTRLVLRNVSKEVKELTLAHSPNGPEADVRGADGKQLRLYKVVVGGRATLHLVTLKPGEQVESEGPPLQFGVEMDAATKRPKTPEYPVCGVEAEAGKVRVRFPLLNPFGPETGEVEVTVGDRQNASDGGRALWPVANPPADAGRAGVPILQADDTEARSGSTTQKDSDAKTSARPFAVLPDGRRVEVLGVSMPLVDDSVPDQRKWWSADGSALPQIPATLPRNGRLVVKSDLASGREVMVRVRDTLDEKGWARFESLKALTQPFGNAQQVVLWVPNDAKTDAKSGGWVQDVAFGPIGDATSMTLRMAVYGPGSELFSVDPQIDSRERFVTKPEGPLARELARQVELLRVQPHGKGIAVWTRPLNRIGQRGELIPLAYTIDGLTHAATSSVMEGNEERTTFDVARENLETLQFRVRPFSHWVTFENVSLIAGHKTEPRVTSEAIPAAAGDATRSQAELANEKQGLVTLRKPALLLPDHWIMQAVGFDNDGKELVTASNQSFITIRRWDVVGRKLISEIKLQADKHGRAFREGTLMLSGDRRRVVAATDEYVGIWETATGKLLKQLPFKTKEGIYDCAIDKLDCTPDLSVIVGHRALPGRLTRSYDAHLIVWDGVSGNVLQTVIDKGATDLKAIDLSTDGKRLVTTNGGGAKVWETSTGKLLRSIPNDNTGRKHSESDVISEAPSHVWSVQFSPDGQQLALGDILGVKLLDATSGKLLQQLAGPYRYSSNASPELVFSQDGQRLARLGTQEKAEGDKQRYVVPIWSTQTGARLFELHTEANDAAFSDDGQRLAVVFSDMQQALSVWTLSGDAANVEQTAGPGPHSRQDRVEENGHYQGKKAAEFIDTFKPTWGDTTLGIQYGIALTKPAKTFLSGERVPLVFFFRNASDNR